MAKVLTYPQKVCPSNIELMRKLVMNGPEIHPGANFVEPQGSKLKKYLRFGNRPAIAKDLKVSLCWSFLQIKAFGNVSVYYYFIFITFLLNINCLLTKFIS